MVEFRREISKGTQIAGYVSPAEMKEIAEILEPSQMAGGIWSRLKARNYTKFNSKLNKILLGHHRWLYVSPAEIAEIAEILGPSQMAIYWGRLKARNYTKFDSKLFKIFRAIRDG